MLTTLNNPFAAFHASGLFYVYSCLLTVPVHREVSDYWWIVRLNLISDTFSKYCDFYFPQDEIPTPEYYGGYRAPTKYKEPVIPVDIEETLVMMTVVWRFLSIATNSHLRDVVHTSGQIYRISIHIVGKYSRGLQRAREILGRCHESVVDEIREIIDGYQERLDKMIEDESPSVMKSNWPKLNAIAYNKLPPSSEDARSFIDPEDARSFIEPDDESEVHLATSIKNMYVYSMYFRSIAELNYGAVWILIEIKLKHYASIRTCWMHMKVCTHQSSCQLRLTIC